jgi:hypothetical protein
MQGVKVIPKIMSTLKRPQKMNNVLSEENKNSLLNLHRRALVGIQVIPIIGTAERTGGRLLIDGAVN